MPKYKVRIHDAAEYEVDADNAEQAKLTAWDWFNEREPTITVEKLDDPEVFEVQALENFLRQYPRNAKITGISFWALGGRDITIHFEDGSFATHYLDE